MYLGGAAGEFGITLVAGLTANVLKVTAPCTAGALTKSLPVSAQKWNFIALTYRTAFFSGTSRRTVYDVSKTRDGLMNWYLTWICQPTQLSGQI